VKDSVKANARDEDNKQPQAAGGCNSGLLSSLPTQAVTCTACSQYWRAVVRAARSVTCYLIETEVFGVL